jgi:hypothetical protein
VGLKFNGTYQLLVYTNNINLLHDNLNTIKKNTEALLDASKDDGLKVNMEKTKHVVAFQHINAGKNCNIKDN